MRITHFNNTAGVATTLAKFQRRMGHTAKVLVREPHPYGYPGELVYEANRSRLRHALWEITASNVIHFHDQLYLRRSSKWRTSLLEKLDYRTAKLMNKRMVFHFHGSSVRDSRERSKSSQFFGERILVSMPDILNLVPKGASWVPHPVDLELFYPNRKEEPGSVKVGFYNPQNEWGQLRETPRQTSQIIHSMPGKKFQESPATNIPWKRMPEYFNGIDIWVDKMNFDFYGVSACEAAACGVPVVAHIGAEEMSLVPDCQFLNTDYVKLGDTLEYLSEENTRKYIGQRCKEFVCRFHAASRICDIVQQAY